MRVSGSELIQALLLGTCVACGASATGPVARTSPGAEALAPPSAPALTQGQDVTEQARLVNSERYGSPARTFRRGSVTPRELDASRIERTELGFSVRLPSGAPVATPAVHDDIVLVSGGFRSNEVFAFHAGQPELAWALTVDDDGPSNPVCDDGVCVFNTESCTIYGVEARTGRLLWSWWLGDPLMSAPTIDNGLVFSAYPASAGAEGGERPPGMSHALAAFDLYTGEVQWTRWIDADVISAPMAIADTLYVSTFAGSVIQLDQRSGDVIAARAARATSAPAFIDGALYFSRRSDGVNGRARESIVRSASKQAREMGAADAEYLQYDFQEQSVHGQMSQANDAANGFGGGAPEAANASVARMLIGRSTVSGLQEYQGSWVLGVGPDNYSVMGDALVAFDRWSGERRWRVALPGDLRQQGGALAAPPASAGDSVVVATAAGEILLVRRADGEVEERYRVGAALRTQPIVHRGWIYAGSADGRLIAIDTGRPELTGWDTWAANAGRTGRIGD